MSVVIPAWNVETYIAEAIESVLAQSCMPQEIVVVDDGSSDTTATITSTFGARGVKLISQQNAGPATARNIGVAETSCEWLAFLDADDIWTATAVESHLAAAQADQSVDLVWGKTELKLEAGGLLPPARIQGVQWGLYLSSMMIRRSAFEAAGPFAVDMRYGEDIDLLARLKENGRIFAKHDCIVNYRRLHAKNLTRDRSEVSQSVLIATRKALDRKKDERPK